MKKSTKTKIMVVFIILIFGMSSIAFIISSVTGFGLNQNQDQFKPLESSIIEGDIDFRVESVYIQNGFTFLKYYYTEPSKLAFIQSLPERFKTRDNQVQLFIIKIPSDRNSVFLSNINVETELDVNETQIEDALCQYLVVTPLECSIRNIGNINFTNTSNRTA